jgi:hypothetical protein
LTRAPLRRTIEAMPAGVDGVFKSLLRNSLREAEGLLRSLIPTEIKIVEGAVR